ncbi:MAG: helix-turn-helix domain-containing protein [Elusimicrobia bacterium]|nr:helix-turn-helix domain-containing protein [Elusimicrobiota bacterium]
MDLFIGSTLSEARKQKKVSLKKIAQETRISVRYLQALEIDTFDVFPAEVYLKGFLRNYAQYLGLDGDEIVRAYNRQRSQPTSCVPDQSEISSALVPKVNIRLLVWSITAIIAIILLLILILRAR